MRDNRAATQPGTAAKFAETFKISKYRHIQLTPFVLETLGRTGDHARQFLRAAFAENHYDLSPSQIHSATLADLSIALQRGNAAAIRAARGHHQTSPAASPHTTAAARALAQHAAASAA